MATRSPHATRAADPETKGRSSEHADGLGHTWPATQRASLLVLLGLIVGLLGGCKAIASGGVASPDPDASMPVAHRFRAHGAMDPYATEISSDNPLSYYRLDDPSGAPAPAAPLHDSPGSATHFDGNTHRLLEDLREAEQTSWTLEFWTRAPAGTALSHATDKSVDNLTVSFTPALQIILAGTVLDTELTLSEDRWHHVGITHEGTDGHLAVFIDGTLAWSKATDGPPLPAHGTFVLGQHQGCALGCFSRGFTGDLDELAWYAEALHRSRLLSHVQVAGGQLPPRMPSADLPVRIISQSYHDQPVRSVAFSPDGLLYATASDDGTIRLWDAATQRLVRVLDEGLPITKVEFSPNGREMLGLTSSSLILWNVQTGEVTGLWGRANLRTEDAQFHSSGRSVLLVQSDGVNERRSVVVLSLHGGEHGHLWSSAASKPPGSVALSPDGSMFAVSTGPTIALYSAVDGERLGTLEGPSADVERLSFSLDGRRLVSALGDAGAVIWEVGTAEIVGTLGRAHGPIRHAIVSPDHALVATTDLTYRVDLWHSTDGSHAATFRGRCPPTSLAFSPDSETIAAGCVDDKVELWDTKTLQPRLGRPRTSHVDAIDFSADANLALIATGFTARLWDIRRGQVVRTFPSFVGEATLSPDGRHVASRVRDQVHIWSVDSGTRTHTIPAEGSYGLRFGPRGQFLALATIGECSIWRVEDGRLVMTLKRDLHVPQSAFSRSGRYLVHSSFDRWTLWDLEVGKPILTRRLEVTFKDALQVSNDEQLLAVPHPQGVRMFSIPTGRLVHTFGRHDSEVRSIAFSPDDRWMLTSSKSELKLWDMESRALVREYECAATDDFRWLRFSPSGDYILAGPNRRLLGGPRLVRLYATDRSTVHATLTLFDSELPSGRRSVPMGDRDVRSSLERDGATLLRPHALPTNPDRPLWGDFDQPALFSPDGQSVASLRSKHIQMYATENGATTSLFGGHDANLMKIAFSPDGRYLVSGGWDKTIRVRRLDTGDSIAMAFEGDQWVIYDDDGNFDASLRGTNIVHAARGNQVFSLDQIALTNNRPDRLLAKMALSTTERVEHFRRRYHQRLRRAGLKQPPDPQISRPGASLVVEAVDGNHATIDASVWDQDALVSYQIWVNDVPLFPRGGRAIPRARHARVSHDVELTHGANKIEVSARNEAGHEAFRVQREVRGVDEVEPQLYFVGFGVSNYEDEGIQDLEYAYRDVLDLRDAFVAMRGRGFSEVHSLVEDQVDASTMQQAAAFLEGTEPRDVVVLFVAGHGLYDTSAPPVYYYLTSQSQVDRLARTALRFEDIEGLLDGIAARHKLLLLDTCQSGELPPDQHAQRVQLAGSRGLRPRSFWPARARGVVRSSSREEGRSSNQRERFIDQDLQRRTGTIVLSSSRGEESSFESARWKNGALTEALLVALTTEDADQDADGRVSTTELRAFVQQHVPSMTDGLQHPTVDRDNITVDISFPVGG